MKKHISLIVIILLFILTSTITLSVQNDINYINRKEISYENLVPNPSFEIGENDLPEGWVFNDCGHSQINSFWTSMKSRTGNKSIGFSDIYTVDSDWMIGWHTTDIIEFNPISQDGYNYSYSVWIYYENPNVKGERISIRVYPLDENMQFSWAWGLGTYNISYGKWNKFEYYPFAEPFNNLYEDVINKTKYVILDLSFCYNYSNNESDHTMYFDDVFFGYNPKLPPEIVSIDGNIQGKTNVSYVYTACGIDPNNDTIYYLWDWGDGTNTSWLGPYNSSEKIIENHSYNLEGDYIIRVKSKDCWNLESDWKTLEVTIPKTKTFNQLPKISFSTIILL